MGDAEGLRGRQAEQVVLGARLRVGGDAAVQLRRTTVTETRARPTSTKYSRPDSISPIRVAASIPRAADGGDPGPVSVGGDRATDLGRQDQVPPTSQGGARWRGSEST